MSNKPAGDENQMESKQVKKGTEPAGVDVKVVKQHIVEFVSDSGEGAQSAGQMFGTISAKQGNGVWTVEIIPAEVEPPKRSREGASGNRIRIGTEAINNAGDTADLVVAFNEQVLYSRIDVGALREGTIVLLESKWGASRKEETRLEYEEAVADFRKRGYQVIEVPMEDECLKIVTNPRRGKNMWALGMVTWIYDRSLARVKGEIERKFIRKGMDVINSNLELATAGYKWAKEHLKFRFQVPSGEQDKEMIVVNGNQAVALGVMAAGIELVSMYPITPATSASHYLAGSLHKVGGFVHQAEDEIAAIGFALGASYAGKTPVTITSGPGLALKTEFIGLAVMAELPLVIVDVQRGGPSTGLPTRVEQGDLLAALYSTPGDAPKIVIAASNHEECLHFIVSARKLAEAFRGPVFVLTDANLATGQQPIERPVVTKDWFSPPVDLSDWPEDMQPYDWDEKSGLSKRPIPGQKGGEYVLTGLAHNERSKVAYASETNQRAMTARSKKLIALQRSLNPPTVYGVPEGDLLVVNWGSTRGAIEEAVDRLREDGFQVASLTLRFLSPLEPGLKEIFSRFKKVMTIEINYSDDADLPGVTATSRRYAQLAMVLRSHTLVDVDSWSRVPGIPLPPALIEEELRKRLS